MEKYDEETIKWLEERNEKLTELESMIAKAQYEKNDKDAPVVWLDEISKEDLWDKLSDTKMEIFKLWYYMNFNRKYGE